MHLKVDNIATAVSIVLDQILNRIEELKKHAELLKTGRIKEALSTFPPETALLENIEVLLANIEDLQGVETDPLPLSKETPIKVSDDKAVELLRGVCVENIHTDSSTHAQIPLRLYGDIKRYMRSYEKGKTFLIHNEPEKLDDHSSKKHSD